MKVKTKHNNLPASYFSFGTPAQAYQEATGENQSYLSSNFLMQMVVRKNIRVDSELHTPEYFVEFACLDFTYEYSCLLLMEFFPFFFF